MSGAINKLWKTGAHPLIGEIGVRLSNFGYDANPDFDKESGVYSWKRNISELYHIQLSLIPIAWNRSEVIFDAEIGVDSYFFAQIEQGLAVWECDPYYQESAKKYIAPKSIRVLTVALRWLLLNAEPLVERQMWSAMLGSVSECADQLVSDYKCYGIPFINRIDSIDKLVDFLRHIDEYSKRGPGDGPQSADRYCYSALILNHLGRKNEALEELKIGRKVELAEAERVWLDDDVLYKEALSMVKCRYDKYMQLIHVN